MPEDTNSKKAKPLILYTGSFRFPTGDAAAARVLGIAKAMRSLGAEVIFGGGESAGRPQDADLQGGFRYQDFAYWPQGGLDQPSLSAIARLLQKRKNAAKTLSWIGGFRPRGIAAIVAYEPSTWLGLRLRSYTQRHRIPLIVDLTEWPTGQTLSGGTFGFRNLDSEFRMRFLYEHCDGMIAVSSFLEGYYAARGCKAIRIPPLVDLEDEKWRTPAWKPDDALRLIYAGSPGNKDMLRNIIRGVLLAGGSRRRLELNLVGVTQEQAQELSGCDLNPGAQSGISIRCHGKIPQTEVPARLAASDFSVLLRQDSKNAKAGFATKFVESLAAGTPPIANATGDIAEFMKDGSEGLLVTDCSAEGLAATLKRALNLGPERLHAMREYAKNRARDSFDFRKYCPMLQAFIGKMAEQTRSTAAHDLHVRLCQASSTPAART